MRWLVVAALASCLSCAVAFAAEPPPFAGSWRIVEIGGSPVPDVAKTDFKTLEDGRVGTSVGCNRIAGGMKVEGGTLTFGQMAATMMACPPPLDGVERGYLKALDSVRSWRMEGEALAFVGADGAVLVRLERAK
jgi:heat shock protein HslJ